MRLNRIGSQFYPRWSLSEFLSFLLERAFNSFVRTNIFQQHFSISWMEHHIYNMIGFDINIEWISIRKSNGFWEKGEKGNVLMLKVINIFLLYTLFANSNILHSMEGYNFIAHGLKITTSHIPLNWSTQNVPPSVHTRENHTKNIHFTSQKIVYRITTNKCTHSSNIEIRLLDI